MNSLLTLSVLALTAVNQVSAYTNPTCQTFPDKSPINPNYCANYQTSLTTGSTKQCGVNFVSGNGFQPDQTLAYTLSCPQGVNVDFLRFDNFGTNNWNLDVTLYTQYVNGGAGSPDQYTSAGKSTYSYNNGNGLNECTDFMDDFANNLVINRVDISFTCTAGSTQHGCAGYWYEFGMYCNGATPAPTTAALTPAPTTTAGTTSTTSPAPSTAAPSSTPAPTTLTPSGPDHTSAAMNLEVSVMTFLSALTVFLVMT